MLPQCQTIRYVLKRLILILVFNLIIRDRSQLPVPGRNHTWSRTGPGGIVKRKHKTDLLLQPNPASVLALPLSADGTPVRQLKQTPGRNPGRCFCCPPTCNLFGNPVGANHRIEPDHLSTPPGDHPPRSVPPTRPAWVTASTSSRGLLGFCPPPTPSPKQSIFNSASARAPARTCDPVMLWLQNLQKVLILLSKKKKQILTTTYQALRDPSYYLSDLLS